MWQNKNRPAAKGLLLALACVLVIGGLSGCGKNDKKGDASAEVVATYKDGQVTKAEFDTFKSIIKFFEPMYGQMVDEPSVQKTFLDQLITFKILQSRADDQTKKEAQAKVKEQMDQISSYFEAQTGSKDGFDNTLKGLNLKQDDIKGYIERTLVVNAFMEKKVTDDQVKAEYDKKIKEDPHLYDIATVSHILIGINKPDGSPLRTKEEALARAKEVRDKLINGGDFAALAKEYSDDPGSKDNGGRYENAEVSGWVAPFKKAAVELPLNQISDPVETAYGYHIMKVESRSSKTFDQVKNEVRSELIGNQISDFMKNELPGLIISTNLPKEVPAQTPAQTPVQTPAQTPAPK